MGNERISPDEKFAAGLSSVQTGAKERQERLQAA
jgi:hypothetical protein